MSIPTNTDKRMQVKADMMLLVVTMCWGVSYFLMDLCLEEMDPFTLNTYRFLGAFAVAALLSIKKLRDISYQTIRYAFFVGIALTVCYITATFGVKYTSQSNAGFLCAMTVIFAPMLAFIFKKVIPEKKIVIVLIMCLVGIALMTLNEELKMASGDILCLLCSVAYASDLLLTESAVQKEEVDAYQLGIFTLLFTGLFMFALALIFEDIVPPQSGACWFGVIFLSIFCTGVAFVIQPIAQQYTSSTHVGVIFCLEPVFAGAVAFFLAGEILLPRAYFGACLMLAGLFIMEMDFSVLKRKSRDMGSAE